MQMLPVGKGELFRPLKTLSGLPALETNMRTRNKALATLISGIRSAAFDVALPYTQQFPTRQELFEGIYNSACELVLTVRNEERIRYNAFRMQALPCARTLRPLDDYRKLASDVMLSGSNMPRSYVPCPGMPVRFQTNAYKPVACRGDLGRIVKVEQVSRTWIIEVEVNEGAQTIECTFFTIPEHIRPAFATTLHDAQGAQCSSVAVVFPPSARCPLLTLETLYTAVSRAQDRVMLFTCGCSIQEILGELDACSRLRTTPLHLLLSHP